MPNGPYIPEEQIADWTSLGIRDFFHRAGYRIITYSPTQYLEHDLPADHIMLDLNSGKVFGIQYKSLYHNGEDYWPLDDQQHGILRAFPWIYYCCSELTDATEHGVAVEYARLYRARFSYREKLPRMDRRSPHPLSWGQFYIGFKKCRYGRKLWSKRAFSNVMRKVTGMARERQLLQMYELFVVSLDKKLLFVRDTLPSGRPIT